MLKESFKKISEVLLHFLMIYILVSSMICVINQKIPVLMIGVLLFLIIFIYMYLSLKLRIHYGKFFNNIFNMEGKNLEK